MLSICKYKGYPLDSYTHPDHPLQQELLQLLARITRYDKEAIAVGVDGCSVPVHAMPIRHMAQGFARLTTPDENQWSSPAGDIFRAMNRHPEMIAGTGGFCSDLIRHTHGKLIGKIGAQGVYCIGIRNKNLGIAVKMEDGNMERLKPVVIKVLEDLGLLTWQEAGVLRPYRLMNNLNDVESKVGEIRAVFELKPANAHQR
jgi:L-asparaginase II